MKNWIIIKNNYVIDYIQWDGLTPYVYPFPYDLIMEDTERLAGIGDWYETSENIFYRPTKTPPDFPENP